MGLGHIGGEEWIKGNKKFLYHFEILAVVFELEKETSKLICGQAAPREFVGWSILKQRRRRQREGRSASSPGTTWHGDPMCFAASCLHSPKMLF